MVDYNENLTIDCEFMRFFSDVSDGMKSARAVLSCIKGSPGHYKVAVSSYNRYGAVAAYKQNSETYISFLYYQGDDYLRSQYNW